MKKRNFNTPKVLFLLAFSLLFSATQCFSQETKFPAQFHYNSKTGKLAVGDKVTLTFLLSDIKNQADYETVLAKLTKQDGIRKVVLSPLDAQGKALCALTFNNLSSNPFKPNYLQKIFNYIGVPGVYFDNEFVETKNITAYMLTKEKQEHPAK
jgi:hypothetical protein